MNVSPLLRVSTTLEVSGGVALVKGANVIGQRPAEEESRQRTDRERLLAFFVCWTSLFSTDVRIRGVRAEERWGLI
jgi:hypothetical protein